MHFIRVHEGPFLKRLQLNKRYLWSNHFLFQLPVELRKNPNNGKRTALTEFYKTSTFFRICFVFARTTKTIRLLLYETYTLTQMILLPS